MSEPCTRFEREAIELQEAGRSLDEHFSTCPDCVRAQEAYQRLRGSIRALEPPHEPPVDWKERVLARAGAGRPTRIRRRALFAAVPAALAAGLAVFVVFGSGRSPALEVAVVRGTEVLRGTSPRPGDPLLFLQQGDTLVLQARPGRVTFAELRVYRNDREIVLLCPGDHACGGSDGSGNLTARWNVPSPGAYQPVLLMSDTPIPAPEGGLSADTARVLRAGGRAKLGKTLQVY